MKRLSDAQRAIGPPRFSAGVLRLAEAAVIAALYYGAARLGLLLAFRETNATPVWPPSGIAFAAVLLLGTRVWPGILVGAFLANVAVFTANHVAGSPSIALISACIATGNTLEAMLGALLLKRLADVNHPLHQAEHVVKFVLVAAVMCLASSAIGATSVCQGGIASWSAFGTIWFTWWLGDSVSVLVLTPLLLAWREPLPARRDSRSLAEAAVILGLVLAVGQAVFGGFFPAGILQHALAFTIIPFIMWVAFRIGQPGVALATLLFAGAAIWGTIHGLGPFAHGTVNESLLLLQSFVGITTVTGLVLAAALADRQRAEAALVQADRHKDEFLAMLAHELRNPLAPILQAVQIMRVRRDDERAERAREIIERQVRLMARLVDDLLDVSRIATGKVRLQSEDIDLCPLIRRSLQAVAPLMDTRRHTLSVQGLESALPVQGDPARLEQVFTNLLQNAAKYTEPGGCIELRAQRESQWASVRVQDSGIGMGAELLPHVFDLFRQGDRSLDRSSGGLGIGLTIVRSIIEMHGGRVTAESGGLGTGSTFTVRIPLHASVSQAAWSAPAAASDSARPSRILVVDDNRDMAEVTAELLTLEGHTLRVAFDGLTALAVARSFSPETVILDLGLPGMDGYEVARTLRKEAAFREALLIAISGYGQESDLERSRLAGFDHHLVKPVDHAALIAVLKLIRDS